MPRKAKGVHTSPENAGEKNMPENYVEKKKDELNTMENVLPIYNIGQKNRQDYKGKWTPETLKLEITKFFQYCADNSVKPCKAGLRLWLGISKAQYNDWELKPEKYGFKSDLIYMANDVMEITYVTRGESNPTFNMFLLKAAHGMVETNKVEITNNNSNPEEVKEAISKLGLDKD